MENWEMLARHHQMVVDRFIGSVLDELDLGDLERNVVGVALRRELKTELVPGIVAIQAVFCGADAAMLERVPDWLDRVSSSLPAESAFLTEMGRRLDPGGSVLMDENLGGFAGESEVRRAFDAHLWEMAPLLDSPE